MIKKVVIILVLMIILGIVGIALGIDSLVETGIEEGGSYAFGVETNIRSVDLGLTSGKCELTDFKIANPDGFTTDQFFLLRTGVLDIKPKAIFDNKIVVESLIIDGVRLNLEQIDKKGNFTEIMNHVNQIDFGESSESNQTILIKKVVISDVEVTTTLTLMGKERFNKAFKLDNFTINNLGGDDGAPIAVIVSDLVKKVVSKALTSDKNQLNISFDEQIDKLKEDAKDATEKVKDEAKDKLNKLGKSIIGG